jgi:hypothetical protein
LLNEGRKQGKNEEEEKEGKNSEEKTPLIIRVGTTYLTDN